MASGIPLPRARELAETYRTALFDDVVPWWLEHSLDREAGGYFTCLDREGKPYAGDKYLWPSAREVWMFSHLVNSVRRDERWLDAARAGVEWIERCGFDETGKMYFRTSHDGRPVARVLSLFSESFTTMAFAEYGLASGNHAYLDRAVDMFTRLLPRFGAPTDTPQLGYPLEQRFHVHSHDMMRLTVARVLRDATGHERYSVPMRESIESILRLHWRPELGAFLENVAPDGAALLDLPEGRMIMPGHSTESAWMMLEAAREIGDRTLVSTCRTIVIAALEAGWDAEYGGLRYLLNIDGSPAHPLEADVKLWWCQCEALYALLLLWDLMPDPVIEQWYDRLHSYTFGLYPDPRYGEWIGYRNRDGSPIFTAKANGWKGFFHLPRVLERGYRLLSTVAGAAQ